MMTKCGVFILFVVTLMGSPIDKTCSAADDNPVETGSAAYDHWKYLLSGWRAEREKLTSYEVRVKGHERLYAAFAKTPPHDLINPTTLRKVELRIGCDGSSHRSRNEIHWGDDGAQTAGTWIRHGDHVTEWVAIKSGLVDLIAPTAERQAFAIKFDPEAVGIFGADDFRYFRTEDLLKLGFDFLLNKMSLITLKSLGAGRFEAYLQQDIQGTSDHKDHFIIIDENRGFVIETRKYTASVPAGSAEVAGSAGNPIDGEIYADWLKKGDHWLPSRLRETRRRGLSTVDLAFDWVSVDSPIRDGEFAIESIGASKGTTIVDQRLGLEKPIVLGHVGDPVQIPIVILSTPFLRPSTAALLFVGASLTALAFYGLYLLWRRGRSASRIGGAQS